MAFKRTRQDKRFKVRCEPSGCLLSPRGSPTFFPQNRELQIMSAVNHPNIVKMLFYWYESAQDEGDSIVVLNLVLEFLVRWLRWRSLERPSGSVLMLLWICAQPETLYRAYRTYTKRKFYFPELSAKLYMYQVLRALAYLHAVGVCHRDIKPHNVLVDADTGRLVLIDFGSAKVLREGVENVSYACSRYYRAPELIFGSTRYTSAFDWASLNDSQLSSSSLRQTVSTSGRLAAYSASSCAGASSSPARAASTSSLRSSRCSERQPANTSRP